MFNYKKLLHSKLKHHPYIQQASFYRFVINDLLDRLEPINKVFKNVLLIGDGHNYLESLLAEQFNLNPPVQCSIHSALDFNRHQFDLIIFPFGLHWINDVQGFLSKVNFILKTDGIFIGNCAGGGTLSNLRKLLLELEAKQDNIHRPHISPFIQFQHMTPLFTHAGFAENIIDFEIIELEYQNPLLLMKAIQQMGESNCLDQNITYSITKTMYKDLQHQKEDCFIDTLHMISFISSQQKHSVILKSQYFQQ